MRHSGLLWQDDGDSEVRACHETYTDGDDNDFTWRLLFTVQSITLLLLLKDSDERPFLKLSSQNPSKLTQIQQRAKLALSPRLK